MARVASPGLGNRRHRRGCEAVLSVAEEDLSYGQAGPLTSCRELILPEGFDPTCGSKEALGGI